MVERERQRQNKTKIKSSLQIILQAKILDHLGEHNSMKTIEKSIGIEIHFKISIFKSNLNYKYQGCSKEKKKMEKHLTNKNKIEIIN